MRLGNDLIRYMVTIWEGWVSAGSHGKKADVTHLKAGRREREGKGGVLNSEEAACLELAHQSVRKDRSELAGRTATVSIQVKCMCRVFS